MKNTSRKPYIYRVTNLETGQYYIGSQCSEKTIGVNYFTSSTNKAFKEGFKTYREEKYKITIIREFVDPKECVRVENYIIRNHMLLKDGLCLNRFYCCSGEKIFSAVGIHHSGRVRKKLSEAHKGTHPSEETRKKMSIAQQGHPAWNKGLPRSEKTRQKISRNSSKRINISIGDNTFDSITEASKYYNVHITTIRYWVKTKKHNAVCVEKCPKI